MKKLKIAAMVTGHFTIPPPKGIIYAPMDIATAVAQGLTKKNHQVYFYAPRGSKMPGVKIINSGLSPLKQNDGLSIIKNSEVGGAESAKIFNLWDQYLIAQMFKEAEKGKYDLLHIHPADRALPLSLSHSKIPVVYTLHDPIYPWRAEIFKMFKSQNQYFVSISDAQRKPAPRLNYAKTIYNGIDLKKFPYSDSPDDYLLFVGRLHPEKGVAEAVQVARKSGNKLLIIGPPVTGDYWDKNIKPYLNDKIKHLGFVPYEELYKYYTKAKALLVPIRWEEPFGLVMIEAMACGTPVIAFRRGSVPEVIVNGKTGYIVNDIEEMTKAIKKIADISRFECRKHVEKYFSIEKMVSSYEELFIKLSNKWKRK